ncbi:hypothetical protein [Streptomyces reniochalinae]|uniref:Uncharacterized protein n=1 Tax=Streptomyces reniochalinae TaxID=2250578 RepID=A0A367F354_9ACTN|nr:hypothetical protein [Streptomyces reniochalinae]RCG24117.1 hypothetical protein DQ392_02905 [Streptomyces reniochalinae]
MRIRTATAAAVLATAAVLGSAGTAFAGDNHNWTSSAYDFSDHVLSKYENNSDNDTNVVKQFKYTNISDNEVNNYDTGAHIGELELD